MNTSEVYILDYELGYTDRCFFDSLSSEIIFIQFHLMHFD